MINHRNTSSNHRRQRGLSLIELMISLVVGLLLIAGAVEIYLASNASNRMQKGMSEVQEAGRFAFLFLGTNVRQAGYTGCNRNGPVTNVLDVTDDYVYGKYNFGIDGFNADIGATTWDPALGDFATNDTLANLPNHPPVQGTDVLTVRVPVGEQMNLTDNIDSTSTSMTITLADQSPFDPDGKQIDIAMVSSCTQSTIFRVAKFDDATGTVKYKTGVVTNAPDNKVDDWGAYHKNASLDKMATISYFIASRGGTKNCSNHDCALYRKTGTGNAQELVDGVRNMQILYGVTSPANGYEGTSQFVTADHLGTDSGKWAHVVSVRIALLIASRDDALSGQSQTHTYTLLDQPTPAITSRRLLRVFTQTFALRNRATQ